MRKTFVSCLILAPLIAAGQGRPDILWSSNAYPGSAGSTISVALSPDGRALASCGYYSDQILLWNPTNGSVVRVLSGHGNTSTAMAFSPSGDRLAAAGDQYDIKVWSVADGAVDLDFGFDVSTLYEVANPSGIVFSPDGQQIAVSTGHNYGHITLWQTSDGSFVREYGFNVAGGVPLLAMSPDGSFTMSTVLQTTSVYVYRVGDGSFVGWLGGGHVTCLAFSPDGITLAGGDGDGVPIWNWRSRSSVRRLRGHVGAVVAVGFTGVGNALLSAGADNTIRFWRVSDGALLYAYDRETTNVTSLSVSSDGRLFAYGRGDGTIVVAYTPVWINEVSRDGAQTSIRWQGGSGHYQVQGRSELSAGAWENVGPPTDHNTFTETNANVNSFYRVQSLPNP